MHKQSDTQCIITTDEFETKPIELSAGVKEWLQQHDLEGFIHIVKALPHPEPEVIAKKIDVEEISRGTA